MWSKYLVPKPKDWGPHIDVVGFFLDKSVSQSDDLSRGEINSWNNLAIDSNLPEFVRLFVQSGPPPIFVGFGSMVVENVEFLIHVRENNFPSDHA
jgi:hypothetical protein